MNEWMLYYAEVMVFSYLSPEVEIVEIYDMNEDMKIIAWRAFWDLGRSNYYITSCDSKSKKLGKPRDQSRYLEMMTESVPRET